MKKIIYVLMLLSVTILSSCEVESGNSGYPKTLQAKIIYDNVQNNLFQSIQLLDLMTKVDYYAQASANEREGIRNYFLPNYTISSTDKTWVLKDNYLEITFTHNQKSINENGAVWTAKVSTNPNDKQPTSINDSSFSVTCLDDKNWKLTTANLKADNFFSSYAINSDGKSNSELLIKGSKAYDKAPNLYDFNIEDGKGNITTSYSSINYNITKALSYSYSSSSYTTLTLINGKLEIIADNDKIDASIITTSYNQQVEITFKGVTERY